MLISYFIGTAGAGKSTMTELMRRSLESYGVNVVTVNLDPGVTWLPYSPDIDAREYVDYSAIVKEYNLGPNGALIAATDMMASYTNDILEIINDMGPDYVFIDTPGQIELFVFRKVGQVYLDAFKHMQNSMIYLFDANLVTDPYSYTSIQLLSIAIQFRFNVPQIQVLSKADILQPEEREKVIGWSNEPDSLIHAISESEIGMKYMFANEIQQALSHLQQKQALIEFSQENLQSHTELYGILQRIAASEDDLT